MKFTCIIRTYDRPKQLRHAVQSAQKAGMDEVLVAVDGEATQRTRRAVEHLTGITPVYCKGTGPGAMWCEADAAAAHPWRKTLDDDDYMLPWARRVYQDHILQYGAEAYRCITMCREYLVEAGTTTRFDAPLDINDQSWHDREKRLYRYGWPIGGHLYHKSLVDVLGPVDPNYSMYEDHDWVLRAHGRLLFCREAGIIHYLHLEGITNRRRDTLHNAIRDTTRLELRHATRLKLCTVTMPTTRRMLLRTIYRMVWCSRTDRMLRAVLRR